MPNNSPYPRASQGSEVSTSRFRKEPASVEEAMRRHDGLVHAFIQRQGGGAISYQERDRRGLALHNRGCAYQTQAFVSGDHHVKKTPLWIRL